MLFRSERELKRQSCPASVRAQFSEQLTLTLESLHLALQTPASRDGAEDRKLNAPAVPTADEQQLLAQLDDLCAGSDGEALELFEAEQALLLSLLGGAAVSRMATQLHSFDFAGARQTLQPLLSQSSGSSPPEPISSPTNAQQPTRDTPALNT